MKQDHIFYIGVDQENGDSIISPLPFYRDMPVEKREFALTDLLAWLVSERNDAAQQMAKAAGADTFEQYSVVPQTVMVNHEPGR